MIRFEIVYNDKNNNNATASGKWQGDLNGLDQWLNNRYGKDNYIFVYLVDANWNNLMGGRE